MAQTIKLKRSALEGVIPTTSQLELGEVAINTYDGKMYIKKNVGGTETIVQIGAESGALDGVWKQYAYTATAGQTTFSGADNNSATLSYIPEFIEVFINGVLLDPAIDFTAVTGSSVILTSAASLNDLVQINAFTKVLGNGDIVVDAFTGDGTTSAYTLSTAPSVKENINVFIDGVYQENDSYSVSGTTLTLSENLPNTSTMDVVIGSNNVTLTDIQDLNIPGSITSVDSVQFDTSATTDPIAVGQLAWNSDYETLELGLSSNVQLEIGEQTYINAKAAETIEIGSVVYSSGAVGNSGKIEVSKFIANGTIEERQVVGIAAENITSGNFGYIITFGNLRGLSTNGSTLTTPETWLLGDILYPSATVAGELTKTPPVAPNPAIAIAFITSAHASNGSLMIRAYDLGYHLDEIHDVEISSVADNDILQWNNAASRWENVAGTTTNIAEGTNLYYTDGRVGSYLTTNSYATEGYVTTAVANLVDSAPATLDTLNELAAALGDDPNFATTVTNSIATKLPLSGGTLTGDINFGDNVKANFGTGSDLQIYHDGFFSYIKENGTGDLRIQGSTNVQIWDSALDKQAANFNAGGGQTLYYDNAAKLATTATGIDVTGDVNTSGLLKVGINDTEYANNYIRFKSAGAAYIDHSTVGQPINFRVSNASSLDRTPLVVSATGIDVTGTVTADAVATGASTFTGSLTIEAAAASVTVKDSNDSGTTGYVFSNSSGNTSSIRTRSSVQAIEIKPNEQLSALFESGGDISFYEDTGTTAKFSWSSANETISIGTGASSTATISAYSRTVSASLPSALRIIENTGASSYWDIGSDGGASPNLKFYVNANTTPKVTFTSSGNVGIGVTPNASARLHVGKSGGSPELWLERTDGYLPTKLIGNTLGNGQGFKINVASTDALAIDSSGNVGIGVSTPSNNHANANNLVVGNGTAGGIANYVGTGLGWYAFSRANANNSDAYDGGISYDGSRNLMFHTNAGTERMRIDGSGSLGLGVAPSAWSTPAFQISRGSHFADTGSVAMQHNAYFNSGWKYIASSQGALQFQAIPGTGFLWNTAPSGTANNAISFTQAMTLDASGNLGIGTGSPISPLQVLGTGTLGYATSNAISSGMSAISNAAAFNNIGSAKLTANFGGAVDFTGRASELVFAADNGNFGGGGGFPQGLLGAITASSVNGNASPLASNLIFYNTDGNSLTERMRITSAGGLSVGTTVNAGAGNLLVAGVINSSKAGKNSFAGIDTTAQAAGVGGSIDLGGNYRAAGDAGAFTRIAAEKANGVDNDFGYDLGFYVTTNGGATLGTKVATMTSSGRILAAAGSAFVSNTTTTSTSKTLVNGEECFVDTAAQTVTLPASPSIGDNVTIFVGNFTDTIIARNGANIMGLAENLTIDVANMTVNLVYINASTGWRIS